MKNWVCGFITAFVLCLCGGAWLVRADPPVPYVLEKDADGYYVQVLRVADKRGIPCEESNLDYQEFKKWNAAQKTPWVIPPCRPKTAIQIAADEVRQLIGGDETKWTDADVRKVLAWVARR